MKKILLLVFIICMFLPNIVFADTPVYGQYSIIQSDQYGSLSEPTYSFIYDSDTGMYHYGTNSLGWSVGGILGMKLTTTGLDVSGTISTSLTASRLVSTDVSGNLTVNSALTSGRIPYANGTGSLADDSNLTYSSSTLYITNVGASGNVNITNLTASMPVATDASKNLTSWSITGESTVVVTDASPTIISPSLTNVPTIGSPFILGSTVVNTTGTQFNYLSGATGTTGDNTTNIVYSTNPVFVSPNLGDASGNTLSLVSDASMNNITVNGLTASMPIETDTAKKLVSGTKTGTGSQYVMSVSPVLSGTPYIADASANSFQVLTDASANRIYTEKLDVSGNVSISGDASGNNLTLNGLTASSPVETDTAKKLVSGSKTGTGSVYVMQNTPTLTTPVIGAATGTSVNLTGDASANRLYSVTDIRATTGMFTNLTDGYLPYHSSDTVGLVNGPIYVDVSGSVGIGTTNPGAALQVQGPTETINGVATSRIIIGPASTEGDTDAMIHFYESDNGWNFRHKGTDNTLRFSNVLEGTDHVIFNSSGNVGIGTSTFGTSATKVLALGNGTAPTTSPADLIQAWAYDYAAGDSRLYIMSEKSTSKVIIGDGDILCQGTAILTDLTDGYVPYHSSDTAGLVNSPIYTNGTNVGIGTQSPGTKLDVSGNVSISGDASGNNLTLNGLTASSPVETNTAKKLVSGSKTGTGSVYVMQNAPTLTTPNIGAATGTSLNLSGDASANKYCTVSTTYGGGLCRGFRTAVSGTLSGASGNISVQVPANSNILSVQLRVDTAIEGATSWDASFNKGLTSSICSGQALTANTKVSSWSGGYTSDSQATDVTIYCIGGNCTAGVVRAIVYYEYMATMPSL